MSHLSACIERTLPGLFAIAFGTVLVASGCSTTGRANFPTGATNSSLEVLGAKPK